MPLAKSTKTRAEVLVQCRDRLNAVSDPRDRADLTVVTAILAGLAHDPKSLLNLFGGATAMIESPVLDELKRLIQEQVREQIQEQMREQIQDQVRDQVQEQTQLATLRELVVQAVETRFGFLDSALRAAIESVSQVARLRELHRVAIACPDLPAFQTALNAEV